MQTRWMNSSCGLAGGGVFCERRESDAFEASFMKAFYHVADTYRGIPRRPVPHQTWQVGTEQGECGGIG